MGQQRMYFSSKDLAWAYANLVGASQRYKVVDYGQDETGFYVDFRREV